MTFGVEGVVNGGAGGESALSGWWGFESLHLALRIFKPERMPSEVES
jgi:hypothetical protein